MFNESKYTKYYFNIIERAKIRNKPCLAEKHHIIPKSMGGTETVYLTMREHFICHLLLVRMLVGDNQRKMLWALHRMLFSKNDKQQRYIPSSRTYETFRTRFVKMLSVPKSELHRQKLADHLTMMNKDPSMKARRLQTKIDNNTLMHSEETKSKISSTVKASMSAPEIIEKMKISSAKRWANNNERQKIADKNSKTFTLTHRLTGESTTVTNLAKYCRDNSVSYGKVQVDFIVTRLN